MSAKKPEGSSLRTSPRCVPEHRKRPATASPSAISLTISSCQSGKAERNSANSRPTRRAVRDANSSFTASASSPALMASTMRLTIALFFSTTLPRLLSVRGGYTPLIRWVV